MQAQFICRTDAEQSARESGIVEIELRSLDQAFREIAVMGCEAVDDIARFQNGKPGIGSIMGDTGIVREPAQVEHLPDSSGTKPYKGLKNMEILDSRNLTDVPVRHRYGCSRRTSRSDRGRGRIVEDTVQ